MTLFEDIRGDVVAQAPTLGHAAESGDHAISAWVAPTDIKLSKVTWRPAAAITGADTDTVSVSLVDAGVDGDGTDELGAIDFESGVNAASGQELTLYAPASPVDVAAGNLFILNADESGDGLDLPTGVLLFSYRNA